MAEPVKTLKVKAADPDKVGLFDVNPAHPPDKAHPKGGEVFITGEDTYTVADTSEVRVAIAEGRLVEVDAPRPAAKG